MRSGACSLCDHPKRTDIDAAHVAGDSIRALAKRYACSTTTVQKHVSMHIPAATKKAAAEEREAKAGDSILAEVNDLREAAKRLLSRTEAKKDYRTAIAAIRELARLVELKARLLGELRDREINITNVQLDGETAERMARMFIARREAQPKRDQIVDCESANNIVSRIGENA